jgi:hypothetical protein
MAGFDSLGSPTTTNVGGAFNPALGGTSGQSAPAGYGIQPPRISSPYSVGSLGISAGNRPSQSDLYSPTAQVYTPGPDTSAMHEANVAMAQQGFGNLGLNGYRGFQGETPGTSNSNYGIGPGGWADINAFMANPMGAWQSSGNTPAINGADANGNAISNFVIPYGGSGMGGVANNNSSRYQEMIDSIRSSMTGQWPQNWQNLQGQPGGGMPFNVSGNYSNFTPDQITNMAADLPLRYGAGYGVLPPAVTQNMGIPIASIPGMRTY